MTRSTTVIENMANSRPQTRIVALATCHNRCGKTRNALHDLLRQRLPVGWTLQVCIVDDGSTDGTGAMLAQEFPQVVCLEGSGNLFWAGGMRLGWERWVRFQPFDYLLVFNDDIRLKADALATLVAAMLQAQRAGERACAVAGAFCDPLTQQTIRGARRHCGRWNRLSICRVDPLATSQDCHTLNMDLALISREALDRVGFLSKAFVHNLADFDFGFRLRTAGGRVILAPGYVGECARNSLQGSSKEPGIPFAERWQRFTSVKEANMRERWIYYYRHGGALWPVFWALLYVRFVKRSLFSPATPAGGEPRGMTCRDLSGTPD